mmetsp:Transcript_80709/g.250962  ORF Transcript_80709/g.250962 Transcript_80709/m.250962 type:complete len:125 (-) Transcript_80709:638-1012(-)
MFPRRGWTPKKGRKAAVEEARKGRLRVPLLRISPAHPCLQPTLHGPLLAERQIGEDLVRYFDPSSFPCPHVLPRPRLTSRHSMAPPKPAMLTRCSNLGVRDLGGSKGDALEEGLCCSGLADVWM